MSRKQKINLFIIGAILLCALNMDAQHILKLSIKHNEEKTPLQGATVTIRTLNKIMIADSAGNADFKDIAPGQYIINVSYAGLEEQELMVIVPMSTGLPYVVWLESGHEHEEEVMVTSTRSSRSINDIPTRVEIISGEELTEKGNMKPGDIRMLLNESTGIQTQQTSATSYNSSIRIQGLDGRYTQLLRDGFPLYSGFSGGLSLMQIAPLDLKQVEVIKGSTSTLYGGGAIAGLVNLVSKTPGTEKELSFIANATSARGLDLSGFYSHKFKAIGITVFGSRNIGTAYDPADIGLTAIPEFERYTINPRLFIYGEKTNANVGASYITENRTGGSMNYISDGTPGYFEQNDTKRLTAQGDFVHTLNARTKLQLKSSYTNFNRLITIPSYIFEGVQQSSYSEFNVNTQTDQSLWIIGANFLTDDFNEQPHNAAILRNYHYNTFGVFIQNTWTPDRRFSLETGLRTDYVEQFGWELLPRFSAMFKITPAFTARLGGGFGYKTPTAFNEDAERLHFQNIIPVDQSMASNEKSIGGNLDFNFRTRLGEVGFIINQLFFYTKLGEPLILTHQPSNNYAFINADGYLHTMGMETNLRFSFHDFKLFIGYTYADVNSYFNNIKERFPLTARHRLNNVLMYEKDEKLKIGLEAYYYSPQKLSDGSTGKAYWINGLMIEKLWVKISLFINFENFFDTRQTRFDSIYTGSIDNPVFRDIYAPVDGFVINGGIKIRL